MSIQKLSYHSPLYLNYFSIAETSYSDKINWYESHYQEIQGLNDKAKTHIDLDYTLSLFHVGRYHQYISQVDTLIEKVISENIIEVDGKDIYQQLLFCKAACYYNTNQLEQSLHVLLELCKMDKNNKVYKSFCSKVLRLSSYRKFDRLKGLALGMILMALAIIIAEIILVRTIMTSYIEPVELSRNILLGSAFILLAFNEWKIQSYIKRIITGH